MRAVYIFMRRVSPGAPAVIYTFPSGRCRLHLAARNPCCAPPRPALLLFIARNEPLSESTPYEQTAQLIRDISVCARVLFIAVERAYKFA